MYSPEEKRRAVELFIKYDFSVAAVVNEPGYPHRGSMYNWYRRYRELGEDAFRTRRSKCSDEEKRRAVDRFFEHGRRLARTMRKLGYPRSHELLAEWIRELEPEQALADRYHRVHDSRW